MNKQSQITLREALGRVSPILRGEERILIGILIYGLFTSLLTLVIPVTVQSLVNSVAFGSLTQQLLILSSVVFIVLLFFGILSASQLLLAEKLQRRLFARISFDLAQRIPRFSSNGIQGLHGSEHLNPFLEIATVKKSVSHLLVSGLGVILQVVVGLLLLCLYHPLLLGFSLILFLSIFCIVVWFGKRGPATADIECSAKYETLTWLEDLADDKKYFRSETGLKFALERTANLVEEWTTARQQHFKIVFVQYVGAYVVHAVASSLLLGVGGWLVIKGQLTLGQLVAAELVVNAALSGFIKLGKHLESFYDLTAGLGKLEKFRMLGLEDDGGEMPRWTDGRSLSVRLEKVSAGRRYDGSYFLKNLNLEVAPGEKIAIYGENSSGKSLLGQLLFGLLQPLKGEIQIDGNYLSDVSLPAIRDRIAFVGEFRFFHGTLEENLTLGCSSISRKRLREYIKRMGLTEKVSMFENGLETVMNPAHQVFSKGEMMRIALIRALLREPGFLIVDQTLDSIDERSLECVISLLLEKATDCTMILMTHEPAIANRFKTIYELSNGNLEAKSFIASSNTTPRISS